MPLSSPSAPRGSRGPSSPIVLSILLAAVPTIAQGFGRFSYGMLLPAMRADLGWSFTQAGWINTANAAGYLFGALLAMPLARWLGTEGAIRLGAVGTALLLLATGLTESFPLLFALRLAAGITGAVGFVSGGVAVSRLAEHQPHRAGFLLGLYYGGPGFGVLLCALVLPALLNGGDPTVWATAWIGLGLASLALFPLVFLATIRPRVLPEDRGALGGDGVSAATGGAPPLIRAALPVILAYFLFGAGYIGYMTFMDAFLRAGDLDPGILPLFWITLAAASLSAPWVWGRVMGTARGGRALAMVLAVLALGAAIPLVLSGEVAILISAALFGSSFFSAVTATTAFVRRAMPSRFWTRGIALFTIIFGLGQSVGPTLIGLVADGEGGLTAGLGVSMGILVVGILIALLQRDIQARSDST